MTTNATRRARQHKIIAEHEKTIAALRQQLAEAEALILSHNRLLAEANADNAKKDAALREMKGWLTEADIVALSDDTRDTLAALGPAAQGEKKCALHENDCCGADGPDCPYDATELAAMDRSAPAPSAGETVTITRALLHSSIMGAARLITHQHDTALRITQEAFASIDVLAAPAPSAGETTLRAEIERLTANNKVMVIQVELHAARADRLHAARADRLHAARADRLHAELEAALAAAPTTGETP